MKSADESRQIAKARRKLKKRLEVIDRQFTDSALAEVVDRMHSVLVSETPRLRAEKRARSSFSANSSSAQASQSVNRVREQLARRLDQEAQEFYNRKKAKAEQAAKH